jgi:transcriptional regulator with XRE-family HTH domain
MNSNILDGQILLKARKILGLSQEEMAAKLFVSYQTYNGYENGKSIPKTKIGRIKEVLQEAESRKLETSDLENVESTTLLNDILKELRAVRRENRELRQEYQEIKGLVKEIAESKTIDSKLNALSSSQLSILKMILENISNQLEEKKADLKSAHTK